MKELYYTPDLEDLHIGYECEITVRGYGETGLWRKITIGTRDDGDGGSFPYYDTFMSFADNLLDVRTEYLTKEQIEGEGWLKDNFPNIYYMYDEGHKLRLQINNNYEDRPIFIQLFYDDAGINDFRFAGACPSINEFRKIIKMIT